MLLVRYLSGQTGEIEVTFDCTYTHHCIFFGESLFYKTVPPILSVFGKANFKIKSDVPSLTTTQATKLRCCLLQFRHLHVIFHVVDHFYIALLSTPKETHCTLVACNSKWVTAAFYGAFWISMKVVYLKHCLVVTWLMSHETAAISVPSVYTIQPCHATSTFGWMTRIFYVVLTLYRHFTTWSVTLYWLWRHFTIWCFMLYWLCAGISPRDILCCTDCGDISPHDVLYCTDFVQEFYYMIFYVVLTVETFHHMTCYIVQTLCRNFTTWSFMLYWLETFHHMTCYVVLTLCRNFTTAASSTVCCPFCS